MLAVSVYPDALHLTTEPVWTRGAGPMLVLFTGLLITSEEW